jgi:hypothetical protein
VWGEHNAVSAWGVWRLGTGTPRFMLGEEHGGNEAVYK